MTLFSTVASEGTKAKRDQLEREIARLPDVADRANLNHTMSKLFMFLDDDMERALRIAGNQPYPRS